tara:strand:- start:533 stop:679 length:147 start_codon:yes stop_codon:yes gene_type:complete
MKKLWIWLNLWVQTINENFEGELEEFAKNNACKMATPSSFKNIYRSPE